uniref:HEAT repeat n=1 Tax=Candidatus Kentrum sp. FW TaxID=2126338 RepID=A0A450TR54_9GAMM|nr:MAG: HEAT repeat [Candidatus Kentron sp. FW]
MLQSNPDWLGVIFNTVFNTVGIVVGVISIIVTTVSIVYGKKVVYIIKENLEPRAGDEQKARRAYIKKLRKVIKERIKESLQNARFIDLGIADTRGDRDIISSRSFDDIDTAFFKENKRRLLILGEPGAGKTTTLTHLAKKLLEEAKKPEALIPLLVNLSRFRLDDSAPAATGFFRFFRKAPYSGDAARPASRFPDGGTEEQLPEQRVEAWLVRELSQFLSISIFSRESIARRWLREGRVAVLLDGLDEVGEEGDQGDEHRTEVLRLLNETLFRKYPDTPIVVCSRVNEYRALQDRKETHSELPGEVTLRPFSSEQIDDYLIEAKADGLRAALREDAGLREMAKTPLTLSIMVLAYGGARPKEVFAEGSLTERRHHLFKIYVDRMLQRAERRKPLIGDEPGDRVSVAEYPYSPEEHKRYLGWLALRLSIRMQTTFSPRNFYDFLSHRIESDRDTAVFWAMALAWAVPVFLMVFALGLLLMPMTPTGLALVTYISTLMAVICGPGVQTWKRYREGKLIIRTMEYYEPGEDSHTEDLFSILGLTLLAIAIINGLPDISWASFWGGVFILVLVPIIADLGIFLCGMLIVYLDARLPNAIKRFLLDPILHAVLVLFGRLPRQRRRYFEYAEKKALLLKRNPSGDMEFVHRLLRDYFALLENQWPPRSAELEKQLAEIEELDDRGEAAIDPLAEILFDTTSAEDSREAAIAKLGKLPLPRVRPIIEKAITDTDSTIRGAAVAIAVDWPKDDAKWLLRKAMPDPAIRDKVAVTFSRLPEDLREQLWVEFAQDPDPAVQRGAVEVVSKVYTYHNDKTHPLYGKMLAHCPNDHRLLASILGQLIDSHDFSNHLPDWAKTALPMLLDNPEDGTRAETLRCIGKLRDGSRLDRIVQILQEDPYYWARACAAEALGELGATVAVEPLIVALDDESEWVRKKAARALGQLKAPQALHSLIKATSDPDDRVLSFACEALGELGDKAAIPALMEVVSFDRDNNYVRKQAAKALIKLGDANVWAFLISDCDLSVRFDTIDELRRLGDRRAIPVLSKAAKSGWNEDVRAEARSALKAIKDSDGP